MNYLIGGITLEQLVTFKYLPAIGHSKKVCRVTHAKHFSVIRIQPPPPLSTLPPTILHL